MKRQIRRGVFETNSSSVHSLTMCSDDEFQRWKNGDVLFCGWDDSFATKEDIIKKYSDKYSEWREVDWEDKEMVEELFNDYEIRTYDKFFDNEWYETFEQEHITPGGEKVIAFGYYGHD